MSDELLKGVMIGAGYFAQYQAEAWNRTAGAEILAVADSVPGRAQEFAERWEIPRAYSDVVEMLEKEKPDFVDIVTRPQSHLKLVKLAAEHGIHAICQKPMARTWEECLEMVNVCAENGVRLIIHENWRWQPWYREIKRVLELGLIGKAFYAGFMMRKGDGRGPEPYPAQPYFREMEWLMVYEMAVHFLDVFRYLMGEINKVFCQVGRINPVLKGEDYALIQLESAIGVRGLIDANRFSGSLAPVLEEFRVEGDRGMIRLSPDGRLWLTEYGKDEMRHEFTSPESGYRGDSIRAAQEHYINCLRTGQMSENEGVDYLRTVAAVFACYRSVETGQAVPL
ncbi:MAG: Gfo/Idh/MocA family oxidoreductase [Acidobacteria bacterium]|nr:Gfo/Idh/MocA family oxidoreductase [Acidobacteriota bacterium]